MRILLFFFCLNFSSFFSPLLQAKYQKNVSQAVKTFPIVYNEEVYRWIYLFVQSKNPNYIQTWLKRSYRYFPFMKNAFKENNLPEDLVHMTLIESSLSSKAVSSAQAVGYWQFIKPTALQFGLRINPWLDERKDFEKSTLAASQYLSQLYFKFDDWLLSMAAYNMGETRLTQFITKYKTKNFWRLSRKHDFPKETALFVPKVLAASLIMKNPERYGYNQFSVLAPYRYDVFYAPGGVNLKKLCREMKLSWSEFKILNPELKKGVIPKTTYHHRIRVPKGSGFKISQWLKKQKL